MENRPLKEGNPQNSFNSIDSKMNDHSATNDNDSAFFCNVCLDPVKNKEPVVTQCGHLYCWPCLYRWLNTHHTTCPVCKAGVSEENVIPIFIRGSNESDPRQRINNSNDSGNSGENIPNRPAGHRPEPQPILGLHNGLHDNLAANGATFSTGFGFFPSLFGLQFQTFTPLPPSNGTPNPEEEQQKFIRRVIFSLCIAVLLCLLFF